MLQLDKPPLDLGLHLRGMMRLTVYRQFFILVCTTPALSRWPQVLSRCCLQTWKWANTLRFGRAFLVVQGLPHNYDLSSALRDV